MLPVGPTRGPIPVASPTSAEPRSIPERAVPRELGSGNTRGFRLGLRRTIGTTFLVQRGEAETPRRLPHGSSSEMLRVDNVPVSASFYAGQPPDGGRAACERSRRDNRALYLADRRQQRTATLRSVPMSSKSGRLPVRPDPGAVTCEPTPTRHPKPSIATACPRSVSGPHNVRRAGASVLRSACGGRLPGELGESHMHHRSPEPRRVPCKRRPSDGHPPCRNTLNPGQCEAAVATLNQCGKW